MNPCQSENIKRGRHIQDCLVILMFNAFLKLSFSASLYSRFSHREKKRGQGNYSNAKQKTKGRLRKLTDLTDEGQPKKKQRNHPSTASRVLKEITQRSTTFVNTS